MNNTRYKLSEETRRKLRETLKSLLLCETMTVQTMSECRYTLMTAKRAEIPVFSKKLANGDGVEITRLKVKPFHRCPKCGYKVGAVAQ